MNAEKNTENKMQNSKETENLPPRQVLSIEYRAFMQAEVKF